MSEIRVNRVVSADGTSAPTMTYGFQVPTGMGITGAGGVNITGIVTCAGIEDTSGNSLTGAGATLNVRTESITVSGVSTFTGALNATSVVSSGAVSGTTGTFSGAVNVDATTDSTSATSGALIVDGGLGVAKNVYIGAGLSVAGTLTYEDVTSVDSVGLITAKSGVNVSGGQVTIGTGITMGIAGVTTYSNVGGGISFRDNIKFYMGNEGDLEIYNANANSYIKHNNGSGDLMIYGADQIRLGTTSQDFLKLRPAGDASITAYSNAGNIAFIVNDGGAFDGGVDYRAGITTFNTGSKIIDVKNAELRVGTGITMSATAGVATFAKDVTFLGASGNITFDHSADDLIFSDTTKLMLGTGSDLELYHNGSDAYITNTTGILYIQAKSGEHCFAAVADSSSYVYYNGSTRIETTKEGAKITGFTSTTAGLGVTGGMWEGAFIKAGKLTDNKTLGISTSNIFVFTTQESTTGTPNIIWDDDYALSSKMNVGDAVTITVITTAAAAGYCANWTIDGNAVTEQWNGGSAPSEGGSDGYDIYTHTLVRKATGTGDTGWLMFSNVSNFT